MSSTLWKAADPETWRAAYAMYDDVCSILETKLKTLEKWFHTDLPPLVQAQGYITQPQLSKLMEWKLSKGKWRPRLQSFVDALPDKQVRELSKKAFDACKKKSYRDATATLSELKGVGPATASAVLAAFDPAVPFMGDEALNALTSVIGARQYTLPHFVRFLDTMQAKATSLNESVSQDDGTKWTAQKIQLCLWIEQVRDNPSPSRRPKPKAEKRHATDATEPAAKKRTTRRSPHAK
ncbi:hypothetical protein H310_10508 [Aphanomyces invadans]|uniref:HhH-GPD domain-containing protein n=1 Tax=Aphanomyces invadans TaxID=157072 RepID=A0A024TSP0_9STRA|nr:hypothetical protein H310_10508 [Aphanomyces invadans]ETV96347.1 hypothetical protein H310_10508 [Aphanomyces invadans]|eukprot:XP_008875139.1 hypothetical protein H310_10508 [Aphanomyces invadans]